MAIIRDRFKKTTLQIYSSHTQKKPSLTARAIRFELLTVNITRSSCAVALSVTFCGKRPEQSFRVPAIVGNWKHEPYNIAKMCQKQYPAQMSLEETVPRPHLTHEECFLCAKEINTSKCAQLWLAFDWPGMIHSRQKSQKREMNVRCSWLTIWLNVG